MDSYSGGLSVRSNVPTEKEHNKEALEIGGEMKMFKYPPVEREKGESKRRERREIN